jgi:pimeloyl-ACP methyl ester carboxylesterase
MRTLSTGHGRARRPRALRPCVRARLELDRLVLHGWSMGGLVSVLAADPAPERVVGLVLAAPTPPGADGA